MEQEMIGDVWEFDKGVEGITNSLIWITTEALSGDRKYQNFLKKYIWDDENWMSIKEKLETEGSVWYVWWVDGVRALKRYIDSGKEYFTN